MKEDIKALSELLDLVRDIQGFPKSNDEDILALPNSSHYTAHIYLTWAQQ